MIIEIIDPGLDWRVYVLTLGLVLLGVGLLIVAASIESEVLAASSTVLTMVGIFATFMAPLSIHGAAWEGRAVAALEAAGFSRVDMSGRELTAAAQDGTYFEGELLHLGGNDWQLVEYVEVEK